MARMSRREAVCESGVYHITNRGAGRRVIFEGAADKAQYLNRLSSVAPQCFVGILAWCLMDNHVHLLVRGGVDDISTMMRRLNTSYAQYFNGKHGHVGPVFSQRYDCRPVKTDEHLFLAVRYIHCNPIDLGEEWALYPWSSFGDYLAGSETVCDIDYVLRLFGGIEPFKRFHFSDDVLAEVRLDGHRMRLDDAEALKLVEDRFGADFCDAIGHQSGRMREESLACMHRLGLSIRQIQRLTGIGRNTISRAIAALDG